MCKDQVIQLFEVYNLFSSTPINALSRRRHCIAWLNGFPIESPLHLKQETLDQTKMEMRQESIGLRTKGWYEVVRGGDRRESSRKERIPRRTMYIAASQTYINANKNVAEIGNVAEMPIVVSTGLHLSIQ